MSYTQPVYSISTRPALGFAGKSLAGSTVPMRLELVHRSGPQNPSDYSPSWLRYSNRDKPKGAFLNVETRQDGSLSIQACEWYETPSGRTAQKEVYFSIDEKAVWALWKYLNASLPPVTPR